MKHPKDIRWKQRFNNLRQAFLRLQEGMAIASPSLIEIQGIIKGFELTFELSWKVLKDYLESKEVLVHFPRDVIKSAFQHEVLDNGEIWIDMLDARNLLAHVYDESKANEAYRDIKDRYFTALQTLIRRLEVEAG